MRPLLGALFFAATAAIDYSDVAGSAYTTTYDQRSFLINDEPVLLLSGSIHYPRSTPAMWPKLFAEARANGLNAIESYAFWNKHSATRDGAYDYGFNGDVDLFLSLAADGGASSAENTARARASSAPARVPRNRPLF